MTDNGIGQMVRKRGREAGIDDLHPHVLRHTFAHHWLAEGGNEGDLTRLAGWKSRQMLGRYGVSAADQRARQAHRQHGLGDSERGTRPEAGVTPRRAKHPKKDVEQGLRLAEENRWLVRPTASGHRWGELTCGHPGPDQCRVSIWSTPKNAGTTRTVCAERCETILINPSSESTGNSWLYTASPPRSKAPTS
jgi:hypothetical protein